MLMLMLNRSDDCYPYYCTDIYRTNINIINVHVYDRIVNRFDSHIFHVLIDGYKCQSYFLVKITSHYAK